MPLGVPLDSALAGAVNLHLFVLGVSVLSGIAALTIPAARSLPNPETLGDGAQLDQDSRENPVDS